MGRLQSKGRSPKKRGRPLVGGPADGARSSRSEIFVYANSFAKVSPEEFPGAALYKRDGDTFRYVDRELARCGGCGAYVARSVVGACPLCGAPNEGSADRRGAL